MKDRPKGQRAINVFTDGLLGVILSTPTMTGGFVINSAQESFISSTTRIPLHS